MKFKLLLFFHLLGFCCVGFAKEKPLINFKIESDTIKIDSIKIISTNSSESESYGVIKHISEDGLKAKQNNYTQNFLTRKQNILFNSIEFEIQNAEKAIKIGVDYKGFTKELDYVVDLKESAVSGIFDNDIRFLTYRNLTVTGLMLNEISNRIEIQLNNINGNNEALSAIQNKIDSLFTSKDLFLIPEDSVSKMIYFNRFMALDSNYKLLNSRLKNALDSIHKLEILGTKFKFDVESDIIEVENLRKSELKIIFSKQEHLFFPKDHSFNFHSNLNYSFKKEFLLLVFYVVNHYTLILLLFLTIIALWLYLNVLKRKYRRSKLLDKFKYPVEVLYHPLATSIVITLTFFQFFLPQPPFALIGIIWMVLGLSLMVLFKNTTIIYFQHFWKVIFFLTLTVIFVHTIILNSPLESWIILLLSLFSIGYGIYAYIHRNRWDSKLLLWIIVLMIILESLAIITLFLGNYNLSKIFLVLGLFNIFIAVILLITFHLINDIALFSEYMSESDDDKKINFSNLQLYKINKGYTLLFVIAWIILVNRNTYWYQALITPFEDSYSKTRNIGDFTFTYESVAIFFVVIFVATFISKIVSFLASDKQKSTAGAKTNKIGSWIVLIRILIITIGILIAFSSAGIPMDRFTIIISALGVGIGFGLQTLVNNLVSGVIIAFEKPVNLDDIIEMGGQTGQMKSIGIRSSVVTTYDGADVIIPNGDLLSQHLTNWTMGSTKRRYEIIVGVAYGTDLKLAQSVIHNVLNANVLVLKTPAPMVWFTQFGESAIEIDIKYWVPHFNYGNDVKSDLIIAINEVLKENDIVIPFPQQDINIQTFTKELGSDKKETE